LNIPICKPGEPFKHLILTGKNGSGKTVLLNEISKEFFAIQNGERLSSNIELSTTFPLEKIEFTNIFFDASRKLKLKPLNLSRPIKQYTLNSKSETLLDTLFSYNYELLELQSKEKTNSREYTEIKRWFKSWEDTIRDVFEEPDLTFEFDIKRKKYWIRDHNKTYDFNTLSDGYSAILSVVVELILQFGISQIGPIENQGVVFIDEIDVHLHLSLQKKILPLLTSFFPKIQFIVTTHSPFVLTSIDNAVIYDLENNILIDESIKGASYEAVVESYFKVDEFNLELKHKIKRYEVLIKNLNGSNDTNELFTLKNEIEQKIKIPWLSRELAGKFAELEIVRLKYKGNEKLQ